MGSPVLVGGTCWPASDEARSRDSIYRRVSVRAERMVESRANVDLL